MASSDHMAKEDDAKKPRRLASSDHMAKGGEVQQGTSSDHMEKEGDVQQFRVAKPGLADNSSSMEDRRSGSTMRTEVQRALSKANVDGRLEKVLTKINDEKQRVLRIRDRDNPTDRAQQPKTRRFDPQNESRGTRRVHEDAM